MKRCILFLCVVTIPLFAEDENPRTPLPYGSPASPTLSSAEAAEAKPEAVQDSLTASEQESNSEAPTSAIPRHEELKEEFHFTKHNESYAAYGNPDTKIQFSFKYKLLKPAELYIGYTQDIFWKLRSKAKPFDDADFNPELFYRLNFKNGFFDSVDIIPESHKSNGQGILPTKRSYDSFGARLNVNYDFSQFIFGWTTSVMDYYNLDIHNPDFKKYVGPIQMTLSLTHYSQGFIDRSQLSFRFFTGGSWGEKFRYGGREAMLSFRLKNVAMNPSLVIEAYEGQGESLLRYNQYERQIRFGVQL